MQSFVALTLNKIEKSPLSAAIDGQFILQQAQTKSPGLRPLLGRGWEDAMHYAVFEKTE